MKTKISIKSIISILLISSFLLFAGCSLGSTDGQQSGFFSSGSSSSSGAKSSSNNQGVVLTFNDKNPPTTMYKDQPYNFAFIFTNYQEHEITDMKMKISGFDSSFVQGMSSSDLYTIPTISRKTDSAGPGVYDGLVISGVSVVNIAQTYNFNPIFTYCYSAHSTYLEQVCIPDKQKNTCDIKVDSVKNTNGPVSLTRNNDILVNEDKIRIYFTIKNSGNGIVINGDSCFESQPYARGYSVKAKLGDKETECTTVSGIKTLKNGDSDNFYCEFQRGESDAAYSSILSLKVDYTYQQETKKSIIAKDFAEGFN